MHPFQVSQRQRDENIKRDLLKPDKKLLLQLHNHEREPFVAVLSLTNLSLSQHNECNFHWLHFICDLLLDLRVYYGL